MTLGRLRDLVVAPLRRLRVAQHLHARWRHRGYDKSVERFLRERTGVADRLPAGVVYEATMRCNLKCDFCYVGDLLNLEGEWREELTVDALRKALRRRWPTWRGRCSSGISAFRSMARESCMMPRAA
jgi:hypothetical protein